MGMAWKRKTSQIIWQVLIQYQTILKELVLSDWTNAEGL